MPAKDKTLPSGPGEKVLRSIARHHLLTAEQITRLGIIGKTLKFSYKIVRELTVNGYLQKSDSQLKHVCDVWVLTEKGRHHLMGQGIGVEEKIRHQPPKGIMLPHRIAVNDVIIAFELLERLEPKFQLIEFVNETNLIRRAIKVPLSSGKQMRYSPDAWVHYLYDGQEGAIALEVDRGSEESSVWRQKVDAILAYTAGKPSLYETQLGTPFVTFAIIASPGFVPIELRARNLHNWTKLELDRLGKSKWNTLFRVRPATPASDDPRELFLSPCWRIPGETEALPLIGGLG